MTTVVVDVSSGDGVVVDADGGSRGVGGGNEFFVSW